MKPLLDFLINDFLRQAPLVLALVTAVGYIAMKRSFSDVITGAIKTAVGFRILQVGAGNLVGTFRPILFQISERFGIQGVIIDPYAGWPAAQTALSEGVSIQGQTYDAVAWIGYVMILGLLLNILFVMFRKITGVRTVFLTGHIMVQQSAMAVWFTYYIFRFPSVLPTILVATLFIGCYWAFMSNATFKYTEKLTNNAGFAVGHQQMLGVWIAGKFSKYLGNPEDTVDNIKLPKFLHFFKDNVAASAVIMTIFFGPLMLLLGPEGIKAINPKQNWIITLVYTCLAFPVNIAILQVGVKMFVAELTTSFEGIREKLIPGSAIAIDCAATYGFASEAILFGFVFGALGQILGVVALLVFSSPILIIPGFVPLFFDNATIGVFANKFGGWRATVILCFCSGVLQVLGGAVAASWSGLAEYGGWGGNFDLDTLWVGVMGIFKLIASLLGLGG